MYRIIISKSSRQHCTVNSEQSGLVCLVDSVRCKLIYTVISVRSETECAVASIRCRMSCPLIKLHNHMFPRISKGRETCNRVCDVFHRAFMSRRLRRREGKLKWVELGVGALEYCTRTYHLGKEFCLRRATIFCCTTRQVKDAAYTYRSIQRVRMYRYI